MTPHPNQTTLHAFVEGTLGEHLAVHVAEHLDGCPACTHHVLSADPLQEAFASCDDPEVPADLVASIMRAAEISEAPAPSTTAIILGVGSLAAALLLLLVAHDPVRQAAVTRSLMDAWMTGARHAIMEPAFWQAMTMCAALSTVALFAPRDPAAQVLS